MTALPDFGHACSGYSSIKLTGRHRWRYTDPGNQLSLHLLPRSMWSPSSPQQSTLGFGAPLSGASRLKQGKKTCLVSNQRLTVGDCFGINIKLLLKDEDKKCTFLFEVPWALQEGSRSRGAEHQHQGKREQSTQVITCHPFVLSVHRKTRTIGRPPASLTRTHLFWAPDRGVSLVWGFCVVVV